MNTEREGELAEVAKLRRARVVEPTMLSLYLSVPLDPAQLRSLPIRAGELMAAAAGGPAAGGQGRLANADRDAVRTTVRAHGRDWLGRTMAVFACADMGLLEVLRLRCEVPERAVLATRPLIWPLLASLQWSPSHRVAIVDSAHAWVFSISGDEIDTIAAPSVDGADSCRARERVIQLARPPFRDAAVLLERITRHGEPRPLVIGGHQESIREFFAVAPPVVREAFAGSFAADPHSLTLARVRDLAAPVITTWADRKARRLAAEILRPQSACPAAVGLPACLASVNARSVAHLVIPGGGLVPGYACGRCGLLGGAGDCPDCGIAAQPVPDLLDEMVHRTIDDGGEVTVVRGEAFQVAARLLVPGRRR